MATRVRVCSFHARFSANEHSWQEETGQKAYQPRKIRDLSAVLRRLSEFQPETH